MAVSGNLGGKVPVVENDLSSHEQEKYRTISLDENCTEFEIQRHRDYYVDLIKTYLALKLKFVKGRGYESYNTREVKKEHKEESKGAEEKEKRQEEEDEEDAPVPLISLVYNILHSIFFQ